MIDNCRWREEEEGTTQARENTRVREENRTIDNYPWPMFFIGVQMSNQYIPSRRPKQGWRSPSHLSPGEAEAPQGNTVRAERTEVIFLEMMTAHVQISKVPLFVFGRTYALMCLLDVVLLLEVVFMVQTWARTFFNV